METFALDLEAIADRLGHGRFDMISGYLSGSIAVIAAARRPDLFGKVVLWDPVIRGAEVMGAPQARYLREMLENDWELFTQTLASIFYGWGGTVSSSRAALIRAASSPASVEAFIGAFECVDVTAILPQVQAHTLVFNTEGQRLTSPEAARDAASGVQDGELRVLRAQVPENTAEVLDALSRFLEAPLAVAPASTPPTPVVTILFTDLENHTDMMRRLGDSRGRGVLREHERLTRNELNAHAGREIKTMGDGFMACFTSAQKALECAIALQRAFESRTTTGAEPLRVRIALNAGEPVDDEDDLFGASVILASRIAMKAQGGEILAANVVRELAAGKGFLFADRGHIEMKGFEEPVRVYEVRWREDRA
jgi:class 3 adenylate cyclase